MKKAVLILSLMLCASMIEMPCALGADSQTAKKSITAERSRKKIKKSAKHKKGARFHKAKVAEAGKK